MKKSTDSLVHLPDRSKAIDPADILTPEEVAERLKTSRRWITEMTRKRQQNPIPHYKVGGYLRFHWPTVCAWLEETTTRGTKIKK